MKRALFKAMCSFVTSVFEWAIPIQYKMLLSSYAKLDRHRCSIVLCLCSLEDKYNLSSRGVGVEA